MTVSATAWPSGPDFSGIAALAGRLRARFGPIAAVIAAHALLFYVISSGLLARVAEVALPQVVDVIANPRGAWYLTRDAENIGRWFTARGLAGVNPEPADLAALLRREALL